MSKQGILPIPTCSFSQKRAVQKLMLLSGLYFCSAPLEAARPVALRAIDFRQIDLNRSGYIERHEAASRPEFTALLRSADSDRDGRLSQAEFDTALGAMAPGKSGAI